MDITPDQARAELARRELTRRQGTKSQNQQSEPSMLGKAWNALKIPEQMSKQGLGQMADMVPPQIGGGEMTGNRFMDVARGTPRVLADTVAKVAPGFVSRGSILAAGAAPALGALGKGLAPAGKAIGAGLEDWAGIGSKGALAKAAADETAIFARIPQSARAAYAAENEGIAASKLVGETPSPLRMVLKAKKLAESGELSSGEALEARKNIDQLWKSRSVTEGFKNSARKIFDGIVKEKESLAEADSAFSRGKVAASLRALGPKNVGGRFSPFKVGEALALAHMGPLGKVASMAFSPLALGSIATAGGVAGRIASNPAAAMTTTQVLRLMRGKNEDIDSQR